MLHRQKHIGIASILLVMFSLSQPCSYAAAQSPNDILIIVNNASDIGKITPDELKQLFTKRQSSLGKTNVICLNSRTGTSIRDAFRERVLEMGQNEEQNYWEQAKIKHQLTPPPEFPTTVKAVFKLKKAISYAYRKDVPPNVVKVILVVPE